MKTKVGKFAWFLSLIVTLMFATFAILAGLGKPVPHPHIENDLWLAAAGVCILYFMYGWFWFLDQPHGTFLNTLANIGEKVINATPWVALILVNTALITILFSFAVKNRFVLLSILILCLLVFINTVSMSYLFDRKKEKEK